MDFLFWIQCIVLLFGVCFCILLGIDIANSYINRNNGNRREIVEEKFLELENKFRCGICHKIFPNSEYSNSYYIDMGEIVKMCNVCSKYCIKMNEAGYWGKRVIKKMKPEISISEWQR